MVTPVYPAIAGALVSFVLITRAYARQPIQVHRTARRSAVERSSPA
jgi:hypothetical protein